MINVLLKDVRSERERRKNQRRLGGWVFRTTSTQGSLNLDTPRLSELKKTLIGLIRHKAVLTDFIIFRARSDTRTSSQTWYWSVGDRVPSAGGESESVIFPFPFELSEFATSICQFLAIYFKNLPGNYQCRLISTNYTKFGCRKLPCHPLGIQITWPDIARGLPLPDDIRPV